MYGIKVITQLRLLVEAGLGSRRRLADTIRQGSVQVNGEVIKDFSHLVYVGIDAVMVDGESLSLRPEPTV